MPQKPGNDIVLGQITGQVSPLLLPKQLRDKHLYICGSTGTGKSKFLEHMIRQDIVRWRASKCGVLLIDPHGAVYDGIMRWLTVHPQLDRPIVPIDLRQDRWIVAYNVLRQRNSTDPAVLIDNFTDAIAYVWDEVGTQRTPLFARWATNVLRALYENKLTLVDAESLLDRVNKQARYALTHDLDSTVSRSDWMYADSLNRKDFDNQVSSTLNRVVAFITNQTLRAVFGQKDISLDLGRAIDEGSIILVNLATQGGKISSKNADLFATLLLSDLWSAAQERGKSDMERLKPFYLYLDEFQRFVTPTIAENLDEARGFGLHMTIAHQFPGQLLNQGVAGKKVFDSVMENASSKVAFRLQSPENLKYMAEWLFTGVMDPDEVKHELYSTKVMGYREEMRESVSEGTSDGFGNAAQRGNARGRGEGGTESYGFEEYEKGEDPESVSESTSTFASTSNSESHSRSKARNRSTTKSMVQVAEMGQELSHVQFRSLEEQLFRAMAVLFDQKERQGVARLVGMRAPVSIHTPTVTKYRPSKERVDKFVDTVTSRLPFALPGSEARRLLEARAEALADALAEFSGDDLPLKRRIR